MASQSRLPVCSRAALRPGGLAGEPFAPGQLDSLHDSIRDGRYWVAADMIALAMWLATSEARRVFELPIVLPVAERSGH